MVCLAPQLFRLVYLHTNVEWPALPVTTLPALVLQLPPCDESSPPWLPIFAPPTGLDEWSCFNSLVVGLPNNSIFWQLWSFFVFKFVVVLLLVLQGGKVYLPTSPSCPEVQYYQEI